MLSPPAGGGNLFLFGIWNLATGTYILYVMDITFLSAEEISCWLPFATSPFFVEDYFGNRQLYPTMIPLKTEYRLLDHAIIRARLRSLLQEVSVDKKKDETLLPLANYLTVSNHGVTLEKDLLRFVTDIRESILVALDGIEPSSTQFFKRHDNDEVFLCYALCLEGIDIAKEKRPQKVTLTYATGEKKEVRFEPNTITWLQGKPSQEVVMEFEFETAKIDGKDHGSVPVVFGEAGLVIDARGRPFDKPDTEQLGRAQMARWLASLQNIRFIE